MIDEPSSYSSCPLYHCCFSGDLRDIWEHDGKHVDQISVKVWTKVTGRNSDGIPRWHSYWISDCLHFILRPNVSGEGRETRRGARVPLNRLVR